jgi:hypothetical protein
MSHGRAGTVRSSTIRVTVRTAPSSVFRLRTAV